MSARTMTWQQFRNLAPKMIGRDFEVRGKDGLYRGPIAIVAPDFGVKIVIIAVEWLAKCLKESRSKSDWLLYRKPTERPFCQFALKMDSVRLEEERGKISLIAAPTVYARHAILPDDDKLRRSQVKGLQW